MSKRQVIILHLASVVGFTWGLVEIFAKLPFDGTITVSLALVIHQVAMEESKS